MVAMVILLSKKTKQNRKKTRETVWVKIKCPAIKNPIRGALLLLFYLPTLQLK
jgi:hypothetical protein